MELVGLLHVLRRHRILVLLGIVVAVASAFLYLHAPTKTSAVAQGKVIVDTDPSELAAADTAAADTLPVRATLLTDLLAGDAAQARIARRAGVAQRDLAVTAANLAAPAIALPLSTQAFEAAQPVGAHYALNALVNSPLPVITLDARGPDRKKAEALVAAAETELEQLATPPPPHTPRFSVERVSSAKTKVVHAGPRKAVSVVLALMVFALWCGLVMVAASLVGARRRRTGFLRRALPILALCAAAATVCAAISVMSLRGPVSAAATHVLVDTPEPSALHRSTYDLRSLARRAETLREAAASEPLAAAIARRAGIPADQLAVEGKVTADIPQALSETASEQRASELAMARRPYRIELQARQEAPVIDIATTASSTAEALKLAGATASTLRAYLVDLSRQEGVPPEHMMRVEQLGAPRGAVVSGSKTPVAIGLLTLLLVFAVTATPLLFLRARQEAGAKARRPQPHGLDAWPHTTRLLPWTFAVFLAVLWLVPFDAIQLRVNAPVDLKFDRLILPVVLATWALGRMIGGQLRSPWRPTWIHAGVGLFVVAALLSVIVGGPALKSTLEMDNAIKQIPVLLSYVSLFAIGATAIRATEVNAFLKYTLGLAALCALGLLIEYRFHYNVFYDAAGRVLPGSLFDVVRANVGEVDALGRYMVRGPTGHPLEAVAVLSMALPIALISLMQDRTVRGRVIYGLIACLLLAATVATARKSALLGPIAVLATIAYFRRRELVRLAPLGLLGIVVIHLFAPGSLGKTTFQFDPNRLNVATVSDRTADYDAVRPDVWVHPIFGRGWGTYDHIAYRVLDSEVLRRLVETGVVGLLAYLFMIGAVIGGARATISTRDGKWAPLALMGAAAAAAFGTVSLLFDVMSFPHAAYTFMYMAGLTAAVAGRVDAPGRQHEISEAAPPRRRPAVHADTSRVRTPLRPAHPETRPHVVPAPVRPPKTRRQRTRSLRARVSPRMTALLCTAVFALPLAIQAARSAEHGTPQTTAARPSPTATRTPTPPSLTSAARAAARLTANPEPPLRHSRPPKHKPKHRAHRAPAPATAPLSTSYPTPTPTPSAPAPTPTPRAVTPPPAYTPAPTRTPSSTPTPSNSFDTTGKKPSGGSGGSGGTPSGEFDTSGDTP